VDFTNAFAARERIWGHTTPAARMISNAWSECVSPPHPEMALDYFRSAFVVSRSALNSEPACHSGQVFELARSAPIS
jgi:hypothetical protein